MSECCCLVSQRLQQLSRLNAGPQLVAKIPLNINRNRYRDVLPSETLSVCVCCTSVCVCLFERERERERERSDRREGM